MNRVPTLGDITSPKQGDVAYDFNQQTCEWTVFKAHAVFVPTPRPSSVLWTPKAPTHRPKIVWHIERVLTSDGRALEVEEKT